MALAAVAWMRGHTDMREATSPDLIIGTRAEDPFAKSAKCWCLSRVEAALFQFLGREAIVKNLVNASIFWSEQPAAGAVAATEGRTFGIGDMGRSENLLNIRCEQTLDEVG